MMDTSSHRKPKPLPSPETPVTRHGEDHETMSKIQTIHRRREAKDAQQVPQERAAESGLSKGEGEAE